jgi:hypothetical protein
MPWADLFSMKLETVFIWVSAVYLLAAPDQFVFDQIDKVKNAALTKYASYESKHLAKQAYLDLLGSASVGRDPWGMYYKVDQANNGAVISSAGPDGEFGTNDDIVTQYEFSKKERQDREITSTPNRVATIDPLFIFDRKIEVEFKERIRARLKAENRDIASVEKLVSTQSSSYRWAKVKNTIPQIK